MSMNSNRPALPILSIRDQVRSSAKLASSASPGLVSQRRLHLCRQLRVVHQPAIEPQDFRVQLEHGEAVDAGHDLQVSRRNGITPKPSDIFVDGIDIAIDRYAPVPF